MRITRLRGRRWPPRRLLLAGCASEAGNQADDASTNAAAVETDVELRRRAPRWPSSTRPAPITIGTKFDQPGFGLHEPATATPEGFDVEIAKLIAGEARHRAERHQVRRDRLGQPRAVHPERPGRHRGRDLHDQRQAQAGGRLRRARTTWPARTSWSPRATPRASRAPTTSPARRSARSRARPRPRTSGPTTPRPQLTAFDVYSKCADALTQRPGRRRHHRQRHPRRPRRPAARTAFELVGKPFTEEPYGIGLKKGDTEFRTFINDTLEKTFDGRLAGRRLGRHRRRDQRHRGPEPPTVDRY